MRQELERIQVPNAEAAERRARGVVLAAFSEREPVARERHRLRVAAIAVGAAAVMGGALATPPGRAVLDEIREAVGVERAQPALFSLPASGRLLVASDAGVWVVQADGSKRLLGPYREASWSPFGRFVVAAKRHELAALEPGGDVRWTLARRDVRFPRWTGTDVDTRIAYLSGAELRVVAGDGRDDRPLVWAVRPVAPAWRPGGGFVVTYVDSRNRVVTFDVERRRMLWRTTGRGAVEALEWSSDGRRLHVRTAGRVDVLTRTGRVWTALVPEQGVVTANALAPGSHAFAGAVARGANSEVLVVREGGGRVFTGEGRFSDLAWSPNARWLLIAWPTADQWVFVRADRGRIRAVSNVSSQFRGPPRIEGWCCSFAP